MLLWQASDLEGKWRFSKSWKQTYLKASIPGYTPVKSKPLHVQGFYSDLLYQPWHCANIPLKPKWLKRNTIDRRTGLTLEEFRELYEVPNKPVILEGAVRALARQHVLCLLFVVARQHYGIPSTGLGGG